MTFVYHGNDFLCDYMSNYDTKTPPIENRVKDFCCNVIMNKGDCVRKKILKKTKYQSPYDLAESMKRLEMLAKPKRPISQKYQRRIGKPIECLLPRLCDLAQPKIITPKYHKPWEEPYPLPGRICNWESHRAWLADRAKPKKDFREIYEKLYPSTRHFQRNLSRDGMKRLKCLARPRTRTFTCNPRPETVKKRRNLDSTDRICKLSEPRIRVDYRGDHQSISCALKISKSAMNYQATERIKNLAAPRWFPRNMKKLKKRKPKTCPCCHQSTNFKESCNFSKSRQTKTA